MGFMDKMRQWRVRPLALVLCLCTGTGLVAQTFRATIDTVQVNVTVTDAAGRLVTGLSKDDFEILEDGAPQTITVFTDERVPISLGVLLDSSDSMRGQRIADARAAVEQFVSMLIDAGDEAFIAAFNHRPRLIGPWTQPPSLLAGTLDELYPSGATALYDALVASASLFGRRTNPRAALVVISDGVDTASDVTLRQATEAVRRFEPLVYAIAIDSATAMASRRVSPEALREITGTSGGYTEVVRSSVDLGPATERIANELNKQVHAWIRAVEAARRWLARDTGTGEEFRVLYSRETRLLRGAEPAYSVISRSVRLQPDRDSLPLAAQHAGVARRDDRGHGVRGHEDGNRPLLVVLLLPQVLGGENRTDRGRRLHRPERALVAHHRRHQRIRLAGTLRKGLPGRVHVKHLECGVADIQRRQRRGARHGVARLDGRREIDGRSGRTRGFVRGVHGHG